MPRKLRNRRPEAKTSEHTAHMANISRLATLGEMAGSVAHEINTPLSVIMMCAERIETLAANDDHTHAEMREAAIDILTTCRDIATIVSSLKMLARDTSADDFELVDFSSVVTKALSLCERHLSESGVKLIVDDIPIEAAFFCHPIEICQVLVNLLNNAVDALRGQEGPWVRIHVTTTAEHIEARISDSGPGIPPDVRDKIFQPFFTTKGSGKGTGIGLSLSRRIMGMHQGLLWLDEGAANTTFVLRLPRSELHWSKRPSDE